MMMMRYEDVGRVCDIQNRMDDLAVAHGFLQSDSMKPGVNIGGVRINISKAAKTALIDSILAEIEEMKTLMANLGCTPRKRG